MLKTIIRLLGVMLVFGAGVVAQTKRIVEPAGPSLTERARRLEPFIAASAARYGLDAQLLRILCFMESRFRVEAVSPKGARGPMQLMPDTARRYGVLNPHDPQQVMDAGARYLRDLLKRFGGRVDLAMAAYNAGEGTVDSFRTGRPLVLPSGKVINPHRLITGGIPPYAETRAYVLQGMRFVNRNATAKALFHPHPLTSQSPNRSMPRDFTQDILRDNIDSDNNHSRMNSFIEVP